jgi:signal transduction histidine kinase
MKALNQLKTFLGDSGLRIAGGRAGQAPPPQRFNLLRSFAVLSLFAIIVIVVVSATVLLRYQRYHIMKRDGMVTMELVQSLADSELSFPHPPSVSLDLQLAELFMHVARIPDVFRANIFSPDTRLIWSTEERIIGKRFDDNPELAAALQGELVYQLARRSAVDKAEHAFVPDNVTEFVETYVPIWNAERSRIIGVVEVYKAPKALASALAQGKYLILGGSFLGTLFLYLTLFWIVRRASQVIARQQDSLEREIEAHKRDWRALQRSEHALRELSGKLLGAQEQERKRIAAELHDGLGQSLSAIKFNLESGLKELKPCASECGIDMFKASIGKVRDAVEEVRRISMDLRPSILDDLGILATIEWLCREFQQVYPHIGIDKRVTVGEDDVPDTLKIVIYRIMQEALNNVAKHAGADRVVLELAAEAGRIRLSVRDNGRGFDVDQHIGGNGNGEIRGIGLQSMSERAEWSGGALSIASQRSKGTTIEAAWTPAPGMMSAAAGTSA